MAGLGNLNMSDMKWIGEPLDVVGQYQKGVNLAEQGQRMQQSADMHPLKMDDAKARTNLVKQAGEYNTRTMDSRVGLSDSMARLQQTAASIAENTQGEVEDRARALSRQELVNADVMEATVGNRILGDNARHQRSVTDQETNLANQENAIKQFQYETEMKASQNRLAQGTEKQRMSSFLNQSKRAEEEYGRWETQGAAVGFQLHALDNMSLAELDNYHIPSSITSIDRRAEIQQHLAALKGTERYRDYTDAANSVDATTEARRLKYTKAQGGLDARTFKILDLPGAYPGMAKQFREENGELNQAGEVMLDKLTASAAVYDRLSATNKKALRDAMQKHPILPGLGVPPGSTSTGKFGSDYNGQMVLDDEGIGYANELLAGQARAGRVSEVAHAATIGLRISEMKGGVMTFSNGAVMDNSKRTEISKLIQARREEWIAGAGLDDNGNPKTIPDSVGRDIAVKATTDMGLAGMTVAGSFNSARAAGLQPGSPFIDPRTGKISIIPKTTGAGGTTGPKKTPSPKSTQLTGDANDLMMGVGGYTTKEAMAKAIKRDEDGGDGNWATRGFIFSGVRDKLTLGSDALKDADARFITSLVIGNEWKTGHGVGAAFKWAFQDDPDAEDNPTKIMKYVVPHGREKQREAMDALKIAVFGEDLLTIDQGKVITNDQLVRLTSAVKKHPNDISKWPLLENTQPGIGVKRGKENYPYSAKSAAAIVKQSSKWRKWSDFNGRIKNLK